MSNESMKKFNHRMPAEDSVAGFIRYVREDLGNEIDEDTEAWLYKKGNEIFDLYYVDDTLEVHLTDPEELDALRDYLGQVQVCLGRMFGHILTAELRLHILGG